jgi:hypothetical protein
MTIPWTWDIRRFDVSMTVFSGHDRTSWMPVSRALGDERRNETQPIKSRLNPYWQLGINQSGPAGPMCNKIASHGLSTYS